MTTGRNKSGIINRMFSSYILSSILVMVSVPVHEMTDGILLNRAVSPDALSMIALLTPVNLFFFAVKTLLVSGLSIFSAKSFGARDYRKSSQQFTVAVSANTIAILVLTGLAFIFFPQFVALFCSVDSPLYPLLYDYAKIILLQFPLLAIMSAMDTFMRLAGKARLVSVTTVVSCLLNVVLTWVFLYVFHWGIQGAAAATIVCAIGTKMAYIPYFVSGKFPFRIVRVKPSEYFGMLYRGIEKGSPCALNEIVMSLIFFATNSIILNTQGAQGMFIWSVTLQLLSLTEMISSGFIGVNQHVGGLLLGENDNEGFRILIRKSFTIQSVLLVAVVAFCVLFPESIFRLFGKGEADLTRQHVTYFMLGVLMMLPLRLSITVTETMNISGHTGLSLCFDVLYLGAILIAAFVSTLCGPGYFWWLLPILQTAVLAALMITTTVIHLRHRHYSWLALMPVIPDDVSMMLTARYDYGEIKPMMENISKFLSIAELPEDMEFNARLICEELLYHVIAEKDRLPGGEFEMRLIDRPEELIIIVKEIGGPGDLSGFWGSTTLSTKIISALAPRAKYDYYNGVCVVSISMRIPSP